MPPSRLRQPAACAPAGWLPEVSHVVEVVQDDVWWEAHVLEVERLGTSSRPSGRLLLRNRMTWESGWFDKDTCRPSAAHREFMRSRVTALDTRAPAGTSSRAPAAGPRRPPPAASAKRARAGVDDVRTEADSLLRDALGDEQAAADAKLLRAVLDAALLAGAHGAAVDEARRRLGVGTIEPCKT